MSRIVTAAVTTPTDAPIEGMQLDFAAFGGEPVSVQTDASGVFQASLVPGVIYAVGIIGACRIDGVPQSAVTVIRLQVPAGDGPVALADVAVQTLSTDWPTLLVRLEALETAVAALAVPS